MSNSDAHALAEMLMAVVEPAARPANMPVGRVVHDISPWHSQFVVDANLGEGSAYERFRVEVHAID